MTYLSIAALIWILMHLGPNNFGFRPKMVAKIGKKMYVMAYSLASLLALTFLIFGYAQISTSKIIWTTPELVKDLSHIPILASFILFAGSLVTTNPTIVGQGHKLTDIEDGYGMIRVSRHPFLWSVTLWASTHLISVGSASAIVLFGTFAFVSLVGTFSLDSKKSLKLGESWVSFVRVTSNVPFIAILQGRNKFRPKELWLPTMLGLALYIIFVWGHKFISGTSLF